MKRNLILTVIAGLLLFAGSCDLLKKDDDINPDETLGKEGTNWVASAADMPQATLTVTENKNGIAVGSLIYDGKSYTMKARISKTKIEDFVYSGGDESKPFTLCDFDAEKGTKWEYNVGNQKAVREVSHKSTEDDTFFGAFWLMVKVTEVTETVPSGVSVLGFQTGEVKTIVWQFNHKFGFVSARIIKSDDSEVNVTLDDTNAGS
jgi:hypothetical protein